MIFLVVYKSEEIRQRIKKIILEKDKTAKIYESKSNAEAISAEAISLAHAFKPKYLITDIDLIDGSGLSLISFMARLSPETKNIVFTNHDTNDLKKISLKIGADHFFSKSNDIIKIKHIFSEI